MGASPLHSAEPGLYLCCTVEGHEYCFSGWGDSQFQLSQKRGKKGLQSLAEVWPPTKKSMQAVILLQPKTRLTNL